MKIVWVIIICGLTCCGDRADDLTPDLCGVEDPANEVEWIQAELQQYEALSTQKDVFLYTAVYNNDRVFYIEICCPACTVMAPEVKNCDGVAFGRLGETINNDDLVDLQIIWRTENGVCARD